jgi:hypothetical protein
MARKLKSYLAVAAPSMKAALEAWGAESNLFHQGFARQVDDAQIVKATMAKPGVVLKRPVGSTKPFKEQADLPHLSGKERAVSAPRVRHGKPPPRGLDKKEAAKAAAEFEREQKRREKQRRQEEEAEAKKRAHRERAVAKCRSALEAAERVHAKKAAAIESERESLERLSQAEDERWGQQRKKLEEALQRARR